VSDDQDLRRYIRLLRDQWRLAAGIIVVCVLVAVAVALAQPDRYRSSAKVLYAPAQSPALTQTNQDPGRAVATLSGLAATQDVLRRAARKLGVTTAKLRDATQANSTINGDIIEISASAPAAQAAAAYANAVARALVAVRTDAASAPAVAAARGVEVLQREDGELLALFMDKWDLRSLQQRNPELTLEPLVAAQL